jgi:hypothetical protein
MQMGKNGSGYGSVQQAWVKSSNPNLGKGLGEWNYFLK